MKFGQTLPAKTIAQLGRLPQYPENHQHLPVRGWEGRTESLAFPPDSINGRKIRRASSFNDMLCRMTEWESSRAGNTMVYADREASDGPNIVAYSYLEPVMLYWRGPTPSTDLAVITTCDFSATTNRHTNEFCSAVRVRMMTGSNDIMFIGSAAPKEPPQGALDKVCGYWPKHFGNQQVPNVLRVPLSLSDNSMTDQIHELWELARLELAQASRARENFPLRLEQYQCHIQTIYALSYWFGVQVPAVMPYQMLDHDEQAKLLARAVKLRLQNIISGDTLAALQNL